VYAQLLWPTFRRGWHDVAGTINVYCARSLVRMRWLVVITLLWMGDIREEEVVVTSTRERERERKKRCLTPSFFGGPLCHCGRSEGDNTAQHWGKMKKKKMKSCPFYLVDPASSHMLTSRAKPCKCERKWKTEYLVCVWLIISAIVHFWTN